ncbi:M12 family metallo-peptidase [Parabacteroides sp. APC149_11_2_Y6]
MKKVLFAVSLLLAFTSCSKDEILPQSNENSLEPVTIDLRVMSYESVMTLLSEQTSLKDVTFTDGEFTRTVELVASDNISSGNMEQLMFTSANPADSLDLTVSPEYVAVRVTDNSELFGYIAYANEMQQQEIADLYENLVPTTRSGEAAVTRSAGNTSFKLNLTGVREVMKENNVYSLPETELKYQQSEMTKGLFSNLFNKVKQAFSPAPVSVPKTPTIDIYLLREKGSNPITHEMNWQVNDAIAALKDVQSNVKFNVHIENCVFKGSNKSKDALPEFRDWVMKSQYKNTNGIFILCRWGGWNDNVLGRAYIGDYNVNNNLKAYGVSCTNAWNKFTMAHEIGHIFGAEHVEAEWYQIFWSADLMSASSYDWLSSGKHKDSTNRTEIKKRLTLK